MTKRKQICKPIRQKVLNKYKKRCAYCGCRVTDLTMEIDHMVPLSKINKNGLPIKTNGINNLMPSCSLCNAYKGSLDLEEFRERINTLMEKVRLCSSKIFQIAENYDMVKVKPWVGKFYFEKIEEQRIASKSALTNS